MKKRAPLDPTVPVVAIDGETYWDSSYSVADSSYWHYTHDPRFRCYLATFVGPDFKVACDPSEFDWWKIDGNVWVSHNKQFERAWYARLCELGKIERRDGRFPAPAYWGDTAALAVFLRAPRSLAGAVQSLYGITRSKEIRNVAMKGKSWEEYGPELQQKIREYALTDSEDCRRIWMDHWQKWPDIERWISDMLAERGERGFNIDRASLDADISFINRVKFEAERRIPWAGDKPILSRPALNAECAKHNIVPPKSMSLSDEECAEWEEEHGDKFDWIAAIRTYRRANTILSKLTAIRDRIRDDGRMQFQLNYHAAHTGRTGGSGGYNMLNNPRAPFLITKNYDILHKKADLMAAESAMKATGKWPDTILGAIDFRSKFLASPGGKLVIGDLAQIEARVLRWLAGDRKTLQLIEQGFNPYEAHAMRFMNFKGKRLKKEDPPGYQLAKARELALGFLVGWHKFITMARMYVDEQYFQKIFGAEVTEYQREEFLDYVRSLRNKTTSASYLNLWKRSTEQERFTFVNSWLQVMDYRRQNPEILAFANGLMDQMRASVGGNFEITLPSGRTLTYFDVTKIDDGIQARVERGGPFSYFHPGILGENATQSFARDVFIQKQILAEERGMNVILDVYDELVCDEPMERNPDDLLAILRERPAFAKTLPLDGEVVESPFYCK